MIEFTVTARKTIAKIAREINQLILLKGQTQFNCKYVYCVHVLLFKQSRHNMLSWIRLSCLSFINQMLQILCQI